MAETIDFVFRDFNTPGLPGSGEYEPEKPRIRRLLRQIQGGSGQSVTAPTLAALEAITPPAETYMGIVLNDPDPTVNGYYYREGGEWVLGRGFPDTFAEMALTGSASSQVGVVDAGVNPADVEIFWADVQTENDGPLLLNGLPVLNVAGNPLAAGEWTGVVLFVNRVDHWQLIIDAGAAASAAASASAANDDADRADAAADRAQNAASAVTSRAWFDYVSTLLADNNMVVGYVGSGADFEVGPGDVIEAQGFRYEVAASGATDHDVETSGGVKLYALPKKHWSASINVLALGADPTGVTSSQAAFEKAIAGWGYITGPGGNYVFTDTIVVGNRKSIVFPGSKLTTFWLGTAYPSYAGSEDFPAGNMVPLLALAPGYNNPDLNSYPIDKFLGEGFTIRGNPAADSNGLITTSSGPGGIDVTWTKDDIRLVDVQFRQMVYGAFKRDSTRADTVHWGFHVEGGGAYFCRWGYLVYPNIGTIRDVDIQNTIYGIDVRSGNSFSCTMDIEGIRAEINRAYDVPNTQVHVRLVSVRARVGGGGYFEGGARHISIEGAANSHTVIGPAVRFSAAYLDGVVGTPGVPIRYAVSSTVGTLTLLGAGGRDANLHEAFIETSGSAAGTINWFGQEGSFNNFKQANGTLTESPSTGLNIDYFNTHRVRGLYRTSNDFEFRDRDTNDISGRIEAEAGSTKFYYTNSRWISGGAGSPEGAVAAPVGCIYIDASNAVMWRKTSGTGSTGWTQVPLS